MKYREKIKKQITESTKLWDVKWTNQPPQSEVAGRTLQKTMPKCLKPDGKSKPTEIKKLKEHIIETTQQTTRHVTTTMPRNTDKSAQHSVKN